MHDTSLIAEDRLVRVPAGREDLQAAVSERDVPVAAVGPTGHPGLEPLVTATLDGRTAFHASCGSDRVAAVAAALAEGDLGDDGVVVEHDPDATALPVPPLGGLAVGERRVLAGCGWRRPTSAADHAAAGGFADADAEDVLDDAAGLHGRGWGDWCHDEPIGDAWERARESENPVVVVNAHGTATDALLVESAPFEALEGANLAATAANAERVVVYVSEADERAAERVEAAAGAYPEPAAPIEVVTGPSVHRAAEPTMALEAIEGNHRLEARLRRPGELPALDGAPALVHTARTFAHLAVGRRAGEHLETRLVRVSGDVESPATVELPEDAVLSDAVDAVELTGAFKAACVGGRFGGLTDSLDVAPDDDTLRETGLGTEGVVELLSTDRCVLAFVGRRARAAADTNCGRCVPCREGSTQLADLLRDVYDGAYDGAAVQELTRVMDASSLCAFGVEAGRPARTALAAFDAEVRAHADGRCPAGACSMSAEVHQ